VSVLFSCFGHSPKSPCMFCRPRGIGPVGEFLQGEFMQSTADFVPTIGTLLVVSILGTGHRDGRRALDDCKTEANPC
jgi:hypothetical protein